MGLTFKPKKEGTRHITRLIIKVLDLVKSSDVKSSFDNKKHSLWSNDFLFFTVKKIPFTVWLLIVRPMGLLGFPATAVATALGLRFPA